MHLINLAVEQSTQFVDYMNLVQIHNAGLEELWTSFKDGWLKPLFLAAIAVFSLMFIKDRAWMKLVAFVGIAAVVSVFIFAGESIFGDGGSLNGLATDTAGKVSSF